MPKAIPVVTRPGGKTRLLPKILPLIAACPHAVYCEPYCGGAAVLLAKPPSPREIINDIDADLINCFLQIRDRLPEVYRHLKAVPESRAWFQRLRAASGLTETQRAAATLYLNLYSFCGDNRTYAPRRMKKFSRFDFLRRLAAFRQRLGTVALESLDAPRCIRLYDAPQTLFFLDPPYTTGNSKAYPPFTPADMETLAALLATLKGRFILTVDDTPANRALFARYPMESVTTAARMRTHAIPGTRFGELIIHSWPEAAQ